MNFKPLYYHGATQVRYYDWDQHKYIGGIGYHDIVIDGSTGEVLPINSILDFAATQGIDNDNAIIELSWIDISTEISGD